MNNTLTLDRSVIDADHYKVRKFKEDQDIVKFLAAIAADPAFTIENNVVSYTGARIIPGAPSRPQQIKSFKAMDYPTPLSSFSRAPVNLVDMYRGCTGFLILSGPSTRDLDLSLLREPGLLKMGVNNSSVVVRPNLWTCVDAPDKFLYSVWADPTIMKFVPDSCRTKSIWNTYEDAPVFDRKVGDCPNVFYYARNTNFVPEVWLKEQSVNWGQSKDHSFYDPELKRQVSGTRSCMLVAIRIMAMLGVRTIFLVGADFNMTAERPYSFDQGKSEGAAKSNNNAYRDLNSYFNVLRPHFEATGLSVYNTNPNSGLKSFDHVPYEDAIAFALRDVGDTRKEITAGMYEKLHDKKVRAAEAGKVVHPPPLQGSWDPEAVVLNRPDHVWPSGPPISVTTMEEEEEEAGE